MKKLAVICLALILVLSLGACAKNSNASDPSNETEIFTAPENYASVMLVTINPQFKLYLDAAGEVLAVEPVNEDAKSVVASVNTHQGSLETVMKDLVTAVNDGGFVKEEATVTIEVAEAIETVDTASLRTVLDEAKAAAETEFEALEVTVTVDAHLDMESLGRTTIADTTTLTTTTLTTTTTVATTTTTTTTAKPTTTVKPTTTATKPTTTTTTTTTKALTTIAQKGGYWGAKYLTTDCLIDASLTLVSEKSVSCGLGDPLSSLPEEVREDMKPDCELYNGEYYYFGRGDGDDITNLQENGKALTLTDSSGNKLVLTRTGEDTLKVTSGTVFGPLENIPAGLTFTFVKE